MNLSLNAPQKNLVLKLENIAIGTYLATSAAGLAYDIRLDFFLGLTYEISAPSFIITILMILAALNVIAAIRRPKIEPILLSVIVIAGLVLVTVFSAPFLDKTALRAERASKIGIEYDTRSVYEIIQWRRSKGIFIYPAIYPSQFPPVILGTKKVTILGGYSKTLTLYCNENGSYVSYISDEHGFRNPKGHYNRKTDTVLIGDSYVHGACVQDGETFGDRIRTRFPNTLSLATSANGMLRNLATFKEYAAPFKPRRVLWFFTSSNDLTEQREERKNPELIKYLSPMHAGNGLIEMQPRIDNYLKKSLDAQIVPLSQFKESVKLILLTNTFQLLTKMVTGLIRRVFLTKQLATPTQTGEMLMMNQVFREANRLVKTWGGKLTLVYIPGFSKDMKNQSTIKPEQLKKSISPIQVIDLTKAVLSHPKPSSLYALGIVNERGIASSHFGPAGYKILSKYILEQLP
jgi:hypothetical protein